RGGRDRPRSVPLAGSERAPGRHPRTSRSRTRQHSSSRAADAGAPTPAWPGRTAGRPPATGRSRAGRGRPDDGTSGRRRQPAGRRRGDGIPGGAEPGEDLPPDRVVPVTERATAGYRADGERPAAQHLVLVAEEDLRVLPVRPGRKARVGQEVAGGPL